MGSEEELGNLLLKVDSVRCKTKENGHAGTLLLFDKKICWRDQNGSFKVALAYAKIKNQRVSPAGKSKVQLQLVLLDDNSEPINFHFLNPQGTEKQLEERDTAKELLQQILPRHTSAPSTSTATTSQPTASSELQKKQEMLSKNPQLLKLYTDLVTTGLVSAEEFWKDYVKKDSKSKEGLDQMVGVSPGFLANISQIDGCNGVKYNLTHDIIQSIFRTYPAVKKKHIETVPHEMNDKEFWEKFFQSQYFHRDRSVKMLPQDIFTECIRQESNDMDVLLKEGSSGTDRKTDLSLITEELPTQIHDDEGPKSNPANAGLLRRFNYHSSRVLKASLGEDAPGTSAKNLTLGSSLPQTSRQKNHSLEPSPKKRRVESIDCRDLVIDSVVEGAPLTLTDSHVTTYQTGLPSLDGTKDPGVTSGGISQSPQDVVRWKGIMNDIQIKPNESPPTIDNAAMRRVLQKMLSDSNANKSKTGEEEFSKELTGEIRAVYVAASELLRHFWMCFPTLNSDLEKKVEKMMETLKKFDDLKMKELEMKLKVKSNSGTSDAMNHLRLMMQTAFEKYKTWKERKRMM